MRPPILLKLSYNWLALISVGIHVLHAEDSSKCVYAYATDVMLFWIKVGPSMQKNSVLPDRNKWLLSPENVLHILHNILSRIRCYAWWEPLSAVKPHKDHAHEVEHCLTLLRAVVRCPADSSGNLCNCDDLSNANIRAIISNWSSPTPSTVRPGRQTDLSPANGQCKRSRPEVLRLGIHASVHAEAACPCQPSAGKS